MPIIQKSCWMCRRTEEELLEMADDAELEELEGAAYTHCICTLCKDIIISIQIQGEGDYVRTDMKAVVTFEPPIEMNRKDRVK